MSGANRRASGPVLQSVFLVVLAHSELVGGLGELGGRRGKETGYLEKKKLYIFFGVLFLVRVHPVNEYSENGSMASGMVNITNVSHFRTTFRVASFKTITTGSTYWRARAQETLSFCLLRANDSPLHAGSRAFHAPYKKP